MVNGADEQMTIDVHEVLSFFDEAPKGSSRHATAIASVIGEDLGISLLATYLRRECGASVEVLPARCTQGTKRGCRLDRWVLVDSSRRRVLYQVEVKNWSAHAIGGRRLALDAPNTVVASY